MKKKIFSLLALFMTVMAASAYNITVGTSENGKLTFKVFDETATWADAGRTVTILVAPDDGYAAKAITVKGTAAWGDAKSPRRGNSIDLVKDVEVTQVSDTEYTFVMPSADVVVDVEYEYSAPIPAEEDKEGGKEVDNAKATMELAEGTTPVVIDGVTHVQVAVTGFELPEQDDVTGGAKKEITVTVPAVLTSENGSVVFEVTEIKADAFKTDEESNAVVTKVVLPDTPEPLKIEEGAMSPNGEPIDVVTPLALLDDYSLMSSLEENFEAMKISASAKAPNKFWTFSCGVDVELPADLTAYQVYIENGANRYVQLTEKQLQLSGGKRGIKANNGVLVGGEEGKDYEFVSVPGRQKSGTKPATTDAKDYGKDNRLEPVIESKNYPADSYAILKDNVFHTIADNASKVSPCKAVLKIK